MSLLATDKNLRSKSFSRKLVSTSAASVLSAMMLMGAAQSAHAQVTVTNCADIMSNPGVGDAGVLLTIDVNDTCDVSGDPLIELDSGILNGEGQDNVTIVVESGTTLISSDGDDENTVIFLDNAENDLGVLVQDGARLEGVNGVIYIEGDESLVVNRGEIIGTGAAEQGVIYFDRDTDGDVNTVVNEGTGSIIAEQGGPAIGIEVLLADGQDDAEDIGVQDALADFPNIRVVNRAGGLIEARAALDADGAEIGDDTDAINIAGNPGSTGGFDRACFEVNDTTNCNVTLRVINEGTIRSVADNSGNAGITFEDDAIFNGFIVNQATGVITGTRNGIRVGDAADGVATAEHTGVIANSGSITGTGAGSRGIDLEGDGVTIVNNASGTISGLTTGIEVGAGSSGGIDHSGEDNFILNRGTISGGTYSVDSNQASGAITIDSIRSTFDGVIRGSVDNVDALNIRAGVTNLTHDITQNFNVRVVRNGGINFVGDRTIDGRLLILGSAGFDLANTQTVTGDVFLSSTSTVEISDTTGVAAIGEEFTLIEVGGELTNRGTLDATQAVADNSALLDFEFVDSTDLVVGAVAAGSGTTSAKVSAFVNDIQFADTNVEGFGETVLTAFVDGGLNNTVAFSNLGGLETTGQVGTAIASLAPDFSGELVQNVFNTVQNGTAQIDHRLNDLNCNQFAPVASLAGNEVEACHTFAETGHWVQTSQQNSTQGSLSLGGATYFNHGSDTDNVTFTYGYDQAVSDNTVLGFSSSYSETEVDSQSNSVASTELDVLQFTAYAGHRIGNAQFVTKASYSYGEAETSRQSFDVIRSEVDIAGINAQSVASYNVNVGQGYYLKPEAGLHYNNITTSAFTETGGLNLNVDQVNSNVLDGRVGLTLGARKAISDETRADMFVTGAIRNDFYGDRDDVGFNFAGQSGSLAIANTERFAVQGLAGVNVVSGKTFTFGAAVNSEFSNEENSVGGSVQTKLRW